MSLTPLSERGVVLLGCGKMGSAILEGWRAAGLAVDAVTILDPAPAPEIESLADDGLRLNAPLPEAPALCLLAVKPQMMDVALPAVATLGGGATLMVSIAAGTPIARFERAFGAATPIVRAMPNTPAAIGRGITALVGNAATSEADLALAEAALAAVGETVRLDDEALIDAVTGVSGSGPAYVFHLIECLTAAGEAEGLTLETALRLAQATVAGAGALAIEPDAPSPATLRQNVTSPGGTTAAGLAHLMDPETGLSPLIRRTVAAAAARGRALSD